MTRWWERDNLRFVDDQLMFAGRSACDLATQFGTPAFFYDGNRLVDNVRRIHRALEGAGLSGRFAVKYAMKANRFAPLLCHLRASGLVGIDACSPGEVEHAIACGFHAEDISFTAGSLSTRDLERLSRIKGLSMNCDSQSIIRRWGELGPNREIGIRVNPALGISRAQNDKLRYSGANTTKFGIYREQFGAAVAMAKEYGLNIKKIHFHCGCGYLTPQLGLWEAIIESCLWFVDQLDTVEVVNVGGGLGVPHVAEDEPLDLDRWAAILARHFQGRKQRIEIEPGDYIAKDCGILLLTVNSVEEKMETTFAGVDAGFNLAVEPAVYGLPFQPVPARLLPGENRRVSVVGNINEALDVWYAGIELPPLKEGLPLALINAGAYSSAMASNHCMRGEFKEFLLL